MKAHYFATKTTKFVIISEGPTPTGRKIAVSGKREARQVAQANGASPYNF